MRYKSRVLLHIRWITAFSPRSFSPACVLAIGKVLARRRAPPPAPSVHASPSWSTARRRPAPPPRRCRVGRLPQRVAAPSWPHRKCRSRARCARLDVADAARDGRRPGRASGHRAAVRERRRRMPPRGPRRRGGCAPLASERDEVAESTLSAHTSSSRPPHGAQCEKLRAAALLLLRRRPPLDVAAAARAGASRGAREDLACPVRACVDAPQLTSRDVTLVLECAHGVGARRRVSWLGPRELARSRTPGRAVGGRSSSRVRGAEGERSRRLAEGAPASPSRALPRDVRAAASRGSARRARSTASAPRCLHDARMAEAGRCRARPTSSMRLRRRRSRPRVQVVPRRAPTSVTPAAMQPHAYPVNAGATMRPRRSRGSTPPTECGPSREFAPRRPSRPPQ